MGGLFWVGIWVWFRSVIVVRVVNWWMDECVVRKNKLNLYTLIDTQRLTFTPSSTPRHVQ
jgi:hypothetical protein